MPANEPEHGQHDRFEEEGAHVQALAGGHAIHSNGSAHRISSAEPLLVRAEAKRNVVRAIEQVAKLLGNTPAICRKCYVHPAIFEAYQDGLMLDMLKRRADAEMQSSLAGLRPEEAAVLALLKERLSREIAEQRKIA